MTAASGMIMAALMPPMEGKELLHHLIVDKIVKIGIVLLAIIAIAIGMAVIWRRTGSGSR